MNINLKENADIKNNQDSIKDPLDNNDNISSNTFIHDCCIRCSNLNVQRAAKTNNLELMKACIEANNEISSLNMEWAHYSRNTSAIHIAIKNKNKEMITLLLEELIKPTKPKRCKIPECINLARNLVSNLTGNDSFFTDNYYLDHPFDINNFLQYALITCDDISLLDHIKSILIKHSFLSLQLYITAAIECGIYKVASKELADAYSNHSYGFNELHSDVLNSKTPDFVLKDKALLMQEPQVSNSLTPMHVVCINPDERYVKRMVEIGGDVNCVDMFKRKPIHYAAACEGDGPLNYLIEQGVELNELDSTSMTPLMIACKYSRPNNIIALLKHGVRPNSPKDIHTYAINYAINNEKIDSIKALIEHSNMNNLTQNGLERYLLTAIQNESDDVANYLIDSEISIEYKDYHHITPFIYGIMYGQSDFVRYLLLKGACYDNKDSSDNTALYYACAYGWNDFVDLLLGLGLNPNEQNEGGYTPLEIAFQKNHLKIVKQLLNTGKCNVNTQFKNKMYPLHYALYYLNISISPLDLMTFLINEQKADTTVKDGKNETCLHYLARFNYEKYMTTKSYEWYTGDMKEDEWKTSQQNAHKEIIKQIMMKILEGQTKEIIYVLNDDKENAIEIAIKMTNIAFIEVVLEMDFNLDILSSTKDTILHIVSRMLFELDDDWKLKIMENILKHIAMIPQEKLIMIANNKNNDDYTPLELLIKLYSEKTVIIMKEYETNVNQINVIYKNNDDPKKDYKKNFFSFIKEKTELFLSLVQTYIQLGCDPYYINNNGKPSMLMYLMAYPKKELVDCFIDDTKQDLNYIDNNGQNVLFYLINNLKIYDTFFEEPSLGIDILQKFINKGINVNQIDSNGDTLFILASQQWNIDIMKLLYNNKADTNHYNNKELNAIRIQIQAQSLNNVKTLIEQFNVNINQPNKKQRTVMHYFFDTSIKTSYPILEYLLSLKPQLNISDILGRTPLHYVFLSIHNEFDRTEIDPLYSITSLLKCDDINKEPIDCYGNTPLHYAAQRGSILSIIALLNYKVDINKENKEKNTPLSYSLIFEHLHIAVMLLQHKTHIDKKAYCLSKRNNDVSCDNIILPTKFILQQNIETKPLIVSDETVNDSLFSSEIDKQNGLSLFKLSLKQKYDAVALFFITLGFNKYQAIDDSFQEEKYDISLYILNNFSDIKSYPEVNGDKQNLFHRYAKTIKCLGNNDNNYINDICMKLYSFGIDLSNKDIFGNTPLHYASQAHSFELCQLIISKSSTSNDLLSITNNDGCTPLIMSFFHSQLPQNDLIDLLWNKNVLLCQFTDESFEKNYKTSLFIKFIRESLKNKKDNIEMIKTLISKGENFINEKDSNGRNCLMYCVMENNYKLLKEIVSLINVDQIDKNAIDNDGNSLIHLCVSVKTNDPFENINILRYLIDQGFNATIKDKNDLTPYDYAITQKSKHVLTILKHYNLIPNEITNIIENNEDNKEQEIDLFEESVVIKPTLKKYQNDLFLLYKDDKNEYWSVNCIMILPQDEIEKDLFYNLQLIYDITNNQFIVSSDYGNVGKEGTEICSPYTTLEQAKEEFEKIFNEKTDNKWSEKNKFTRKPDKYFLIQGSNLHLNHQELLKHFNYTTCPKFKSEESSLTHLFLSIIRSSKYSKIFKDNGIDLHSLNDCMQQFNRLPNAIYADKIINILLTSQYKIDQIDPFAQVSQYVKIDNLDPKESEYDIIMKYINATKKSKDYHYYKDCAISGIFKLNRKGEDESIKKWNKTPNHMLLFHGTKVFNLLGIFRDGLKLAPEEAPISGYRFGKGIYFSNDFTRSYPFCYSFYSKESNKTRSYLLLCEVVLGNCYKTYPYPYYDRELLQEYGYDSLVSKSMYQLEEDKNHITKEGLIIPLGNKIDVRNESDIYQKQIIKKKKDDSNDDKYSSTYSPEEFVVFEQSQVRLKYLVQIDQ